MVKVKATLVGSTPHRSQVDTKGLITPSKFNTSIRLEHDEVDHNCPDLQVPTKPPLAPPPQPPGTNMAGAQGEECIGPHGHWMSDMT